MNSHKHARLTAIGRALLVSRVLDEGWSVAAASQAAGVSKRTGFKWLARFKAEGPQGLADRSSRPRRCPLALTPQEQRQLEACSAPSTAHLPATLMPAPRVRRAGEPPLAVSWLATETLLLLELGEPLTYVGAAA